MKLERYLPNMSDEIKPGIINPFLKSRKSVDKLRKNMIRQSARERRDQEDKT